MDKREGREREGTKRVRGGEGKETRPQLKFLATPLRHVLITKIGTRSVAIFRRTR